MPSAPMSSCAFCSSFGSITRRLPQPQWQPQPPARLLMLLAMLPVPLVPLQPPPQLLLTLPRVQAPQLETLLLQFLPPLWQQSLPPLARLLPPR